MLINYFIDPTHYPTETFLTYDNGTPFASFGSKVLTPSTPKMALPYAPPDDGHPRALLSEFLCLSLSGKVGARRSWLPEVGPTGKKKNLNRTDPRSQYTAPCLDDKLAVWNKATVTFEGKRLLMLWSNDFEQEMNWEAFALANQLDTVPSSKYKHFVYDDAFLLLSQMWKPYVDFPTAKYVQSEDFEGKVKPHFRGKWWWAVKIDGGWRLFADDVNKLSEAKRMIAV